METFSLLKKSFRKFSNSGCFWRNFVLSKFYVETGRLNREQKYKLCIFLEEINPTLPCFRSPPPTNPTIVIVVVIVKISQIRIYVYFVFEFLTKKVRERERKSIEKNEWQERDKERKESELCILVTRWHTQKVGINKL